MTPAFAVQRHESPVFDESLRRGFDGSQLTIFGQDDQGTSCADELPVAEATAFPTPAAGGQFRHIRE